MLHRTVSPLGRTCPPRLRIVALTFALAWTSACTSVPGIAVHVPNELAASELAASALSASGESADLVRIPPAEAALPGGGVGNWVELPSDPATAPSLETDRASLDPNALSLDVLDREAIEAMFQRNESLEVHGSIWFFFGKRYLSDTSFWSPVDQPTIGGFDVSYDFVKEFPLAFEFGFQYAKAEDEDPSSGVREQYETFEIYLGLRKSWDINFFATHLYVGSGVSYSLADATLQDGTGGAHGYEDQVLGFYVHTGFYVPLGTYLVAGVDLRGLLAGKYQLGPNSAGADYLQASLLAGFSW